MGVERGKEMDKMTNKLALAKEYAPILLCDEREPFFPVRVGVSVFEEPGPSPSFRREVPFQPGRDRYVIEYAIYWDYDIQHLYELEHVWVCIGADGEVTYCEASFHGKYWRGLRKDRGNLSGKRVQLYCQPGKHAMTPIVELFDLIPNFETCTDEDAGDAGLIMTSPFQDMYEMSDEIDALVRAHLRKYRFKPSEKYVPYEAPPELFVTWEQLREEVPERIRRIVKELRELAAEGTEE